jgi:hypothetical protein
LRAVRPQPSPTRLSGKLYATTWTDIFWINMEQTLVVPCMKTGCCGRRKSQSPPQERSVKSSFAAREGAGTSNESQKRKCSPALQRALAQCRQPSLALQYMSIAMTMCRQTLALSSTEKPPEGPPFHFLRTLQPNATLWRFLRPLKLPKRANELHNSPQAMLRPRERAEQRLPSPFARLGLDGYLTDPPYKRTSNARQLARATLQPGIFHSLALGVSSARYHPKDHALPRSQLQDNSAGKARREGW